TPLMLITRVFITLLSIHIALTSISFVFFFSSRRRHTTWPRDWSSDVCSSDLITTGGTPQGTLLMLDPPDVIRKKVKSAVTDSGTDVRRAEDKPGVTALIEIMTVATGEAPDAIEARYDSGGYGQFKADVAEAVIALLEP